MNNRQSGSEMSIIDMNEKKEKQTKKRRKTLENHHQETNHLFHNYICNNLPRTIHQISITYVLLKVT